MSVNAVGNSGGFNIKEVVVQASSKTSASKATAASSATSDTTAAAGSSAGSGSASSSAVVSTSSSNTKTYDNKDLNKDGKVTYQEEIKYDLAHPSEKTDDKETLNQLVGASQTQLDVSA